jgi:hypothetical protein
MYPGHRERVSDPMGEPNRSNEPLLASAVWTYGYSDCPQNSALLPIDHPVEVSPTGVF